MSTDYNALFNAINDAVFVHDTATGAVLDINDRVCELYKTTREDVLRLGAPGFSAGVPPYTEKEIGQWIHKALTEGTQTFEWYSKKRTGELFWVEVTLKRVTFGEQERLLAIVHDITERKHRTTNLEQLVAERTADLRQSNHILQSVLDAPLLTAWWKDLNLVYLGCNGQFAKAAGLPNPQAVVGLSDDDLPWRELADGYRVDDRAVIESNQPKYHIIERQVRAQRWIETNKVPLRDANGQVIGVLGTYEDITERVESETALRQSESRFKSLMEQSSITMMLFDPDGVLRDANSALDKMWHFDSKLLIGNYNILTDPKINDNFRTSLQQAFAGEASEAETYYDPILLDEVGEPRWIVNKAYPLKDETGKVISVVVVNEDITERKQAEAERQRLQQQIIEAQQQSLKDLSTPIIPIMDRIIVLPLIGAIDSTRAGDLTRALLKGISNYRAKVVILDITGVPLVDTGIANHLDKTIQAARLKGARTIITGVSDGVAETLVDLGIDWQGVQTLRDLQTGLVAALESLGIVLQKTSR